MFRILVPDFFNPAPLANPSGIFASIIPIIIDALTILFSSKLIPILADSGMPSIKAPIISEYDIFFLQLVLPASLVVGEWASLAPNLDTNLFKLL